MSKKTITITNEKFLSLVKQYSEEGFSLDFSRPHSENKSELISIFSKRDENGLTVRMLTSDLTGEPKTLRTFHNVTIERID